MTNRLICVLLLFFILTSCTQKRPAQIVIRTNNVYDRHNSYNKYKYRYSSNRKRSSKKFNNNKNLSRITIKKGDTLYDIAQENNVLIRDLINENNLKAPYILRIGDRLVIPQNNYHQVVAGDTLYDISRDYGININNLIAMNGLEKPYNIKVGDKLKIPNSSSFKTRKTNKKNNIYQAKSSKSTGYSNDKFIWPVKGKVISKFGYKSGGLYNDGINIKAENNTPVKVVKDGTVAYVGNELRGYGNLIIVKHANNWISAYAHLGEAKVARGSKVKKGSIIASVGSTGNVDYPQLYFGIRKGREAVNPEKYLKS